MGLFVIGECEEARDTYDQERVEAGSLAEGLESREIEGERQQDEGDQWLG